MPRNVKNASLETRKARTRLNYRKEPYWYSIGQGVHVGYYKGTISSKWFARIRITDGKKSATYHKEQIGRPDDTLDSDGVTILNFYQAQEKARTCFQEKALRALGYVPKRDYTISEISTIYMDWFKNNRKGLKETRLAINAHILPFFGELHVRKLTTKMIRDWLDQLASTPARKRAPKGSSTVFKRPPQTDEEKRARKSSANRTLAIFKAMLNKSFQDELVNDDVQWRRVKPFIKVDQPIVTFLTERECVKLLSACNPSLQKLVQAALFTGARYSELATLIREDVNINTGNILIKASKSGKPRYIPLSAAGINFFKSAIDNKKSDSLVFSKENGEKWGRNHQVRQLAEACRKAQISSVRFHDLRHTYASLLAQAGVDLLVISKLLGHADTRVTSRHYAHLCDNTLAKAVNNLLPTFEKRPHSEQDL